MSNKSTKNPSDILKTMLSGGHVTSEQWQTYKQIRSGDIICSDSDVETEDDSEDDIPDEDNTTNVDKDNNSCEDLVQIAETAQTNQLKWNSDITVRYIDGKISFNELADIMENTDNKEDSIDSTDVDNNQESGLAFEKELIESENRNRKKKSSNKSKGMATTSSGSQGSRPRRRLPRDLQGLVGEANMMFARGDHEEAIKMSMEVIRLSPNSPEPFQTLGMIYEEMGDESKAFQFLLIAAYLCPSDGDNWIKVAEMANEQQNTKLAIACFSKAIKVFPNNINLHFERCQLYEKVGDMKKALEGYENLMKALQPSDGELALQLAKDIVKIQYNSGNISQAINVIEAALEKHNSFVTSEEVNVYIELLITNQQYIEALIAFRKYCGVRIYSGDNECNQLNDEILSKYDITIHLIYLVLPIDLRTKLIVTLINLRCLLSVDELLSAVLTESPDEIGDLYLDIIDAFMKIELYEKAKFIVAKLVDSEVYNVAHVWFRYAKCLKETEEIDASIIAYSTVVRLAPNHFEARLMLSRLLLSVGKEKEALEIASQCDSESEIDLDLLLMRCKLLYSQELWSDFSIAARILLLSDMIYLKHHKELSTMITSTTHRTRIEALRDVHRDLGLSDDDWQPPKYIGNSIHSEELIEIFVKLCYTLLYKLHDYDEAVKIAFSAYTSTSFSNKEEVIDFYAMMCCYVSKNMLYTYPLIKALINRNLKNNQIWNIFCPVMSRFYQDLRHNRFCIRLFIKNPENIALAYFNGHNALMSGSYKHALAEYVSVLKECPKDPFAAFSVALAFVHLASQKFTSNRHSIVIQLCAFLDLYLELRGECQESLYNVGRAFHQLGLVHNSVHFYRKALESNIEIDAKDKQVFDLRREISYNLSLIYRNSGANDLALEVLRQNFVL